MFNKPSAMTSLLVLSLVLYAASQTIPVLSSTTAYPSVADTETTDCSVSGTDELIPVRREVYDGGRIIDITHRYSPDMPEYGSSEGIGQVVWLAQSMKNGSLANQSEMKLSSHTGTHVDAPGHFFDHYFDAGFDVDTLDLEVLNVNYNQSEMKLPSHTGTHVDAPGHFFDHYFDAGFDVDTLDLEVLNGPALLVDVPRDSNITAEVMKSLNIPKGVRRVLFRTLNTDRRLMFKKESDLSYVGFMEDGARWLVENTDIKLVGIDYLSAAAYDDLATAHFVFLESREIILVEALKLDDVPAGIYTVHCLPLRLLGAEGSPIRCILIK